MAIRAGAPRTLGVGPENAAIRFGEEAKTEGAWAGRRLMFVNGGPGFELSFWCGTCAPLFERLEGANEKFTIGELAAILEEGADDLDESVIAAYGQLLEAGDYIPLLIETNPVLTVPGDDLDYFAHEQVDTFGIDGFWGLPHNPKTPYYRTFETSVSAKAHMYEFIVPMVPPSWNEEQRVLQYRARLSAGSVPTAVAVSILDISGPEGHEPSSGWHQHWNLTHFLLDGHHKVQASAETGRPIRLLSLLSVDSSLAKPRASIHPSRIAAILQVPEPGRCIGSLRAWPATCCPASGVNSGSPRAALRRGQGQGSAGNLDIASCGSIDH